MVWGWCWCRAGGASLSRLSVCLCVIVCGHVFIFTSIRWHLCSAAATAGRTSGHKGTPQKEHRVVLYMWKWNLGSIYSGNSSDLYLSLMGIGRLLLRLWWKKLFYRREVYGESTELWLGGNAWLRGQGGGPGRGRDRLWRLSPLGIHMAASPLVSNQVASSRGM